MATGVGILIGTGDHFQALSGRISTVFILVAFKEVALTSRRSYAVIEASFASGVVPEEEQICQRLTSYGFHVSSIAFKGAKSGAMQIKAHVWAGEGAAKVRSRLAMEFLNDPDIADFSLEPVRK